MSLSPRKVVVGVVMTLGAIALGFAALRRFAPDNVKNWFRI